MTKRQFIVFCRQFGCKCIYSGKEQIMYVAGNTQEDIELLAIQHFGLSSDFKIVLQKP